MKKSAQLKTTHQGFTLVEIMIVVVIIGLLAAIAIPAFRKIQESSRASVIANDLRVFAEAFQNYNLEQGKWPDADLVQGSFPAGMVGYLPTSWVEDSPIGGYYAFNVDPGAGIGAMVLLSKTNMDSSLMQKIDELLDDGNLGQGRVIGDNQSLDYAIE